MSYLGNTPTQQAFTPAIDYFSGNGSTTAFTLSRPVASVAQVQAVIENVAQNPTSAFTVSGNTITFTSAPPSGTNNIYVYYTSPITQFLGPWGLIGSSLSYTGGNVGIGTSSPNQKLQVHNPIASSSLVQMTNASTGSAGGDGCYFGIDASGNAYAWNQENGPLLFGTNNGERMRIDASGNVGIGTSSPNSKLQVNSGTNIGGLLIGFNGGSDNFYDANTHYWRTGNGTERMRIDSSGNLLVGTTATSPGYLNTTTGSVLNPNGLNCFSRSGADFSVIVNNNTGSTYYLIAFRAAGASTGSITSNGTTTSYTTTSDYRLKENIAPMTGALTVLSQLKPCTYTWKSNGSGSQGFIAHELAEVVPEAVTGEKDAVDEEGNIKPQGIDTSFLVATLTAAIQEQQAIIASLTARIEALETK